VTVPAQLKALKMSESLGLLRIDFSSNKQYNYTAIYFG